MKKSTFKLALRPETLRVLANIDLAQAAGGSNPNAQVMGTEGPNTTCVAQAGAKP